MPTHLPPPCATSDARSAIIGGEVTGHHILDIEGYSHIKEQLRHGDSTTSLPFTVGGCSWYISYYPNGCRHSADGFIGIFLCLERSRGAAAACVKARVKFSLLDRAGKPVPSHSHTTVLIFDDKIFVSADYPCCFGFAEFMRRADLEKSEHLKDDSFTIRCDITIANKLCKERRRAAYGLTLVKVPPSDLHHHLGELLASKQGADVTFRVAGETFRAHRYILASRSPVFQAELLGPMRESHAASSVVEVQDMEAQVFQALLEFVYTDALPQDMTREEEAVICQHLLVAADRYSMERLKLVCEDRLCRHIKVASVATTLALAEQHRCRGLKEACLQFLESPAVLNAVAADEGFDYLANTCPSVLKDLILKLTDCHLDLWGKQVS
ncbi:BTB/POZ and MATH domain-containing protein 1 [Sorghum bicolor]|uniref:BTB domain-containing protein n=1 Tax=Sorghum bicolor TaxID=4558 RepID=C5X1F1_SORBI|nr:BTB/POZ and MATH domain-containing protein 1 [Sorghum bicolor]EER91588.1 hypothetical protein SORBI_3001G242700 [Sorghum bicolor]|eukprot:XP_002464590.1 BTB/POZ and MATH domain-containing protein 1 [Sorghum bicolor]